MNYNDGILLPCPVDQHDRGAAADHLGHPPGGVIRGAGVIGDPKYIAGFYAASIGTAAVGAVAADISAVEEGQIFGTGFNGNYPQLNSSDYFRVGWSYIGETGEYVFRIGGDWVGGGHSNLWPPSWWLGKPF